jgi:hypothetical protein
VKTVYEAGLGLSAIWAKQCASRCVEGLASIPLWFLCLFCECPSQVLPECPRTTFAQNEKFYPHNVLLGPGLAVVCGDATSPCKNLVKIKN